MKAGRLLRSLFAGALGVALVIGLFFLTGISLASFERLFIHLDGRAFAGIVVCSLLYVVLGGVKWHLIAGVPAPRPYFYTYYTAQAMLLSQFLPTPVAIAVNRAGVMKFKQNVALKKGFLNALYDMGFDFGIATILVPISLLQWYFHLNPLFWPVMGFLAVLICGVVLVHIPGFVPSAWLAKLKLEHERKHGLLSKRIIGLMMFLSSVRFGLIVLRLMLGVAALKVAIPVSAIAYATPLATMSALVMLTPANLGIAEWSWAYVLTLWSVPVAVGALYGVSFRVLVFAAQLIVSALCWIVFTGAQRR